MFTIPFEIALCIAFFILGALEGARLWAWVESWFVKEVKVVENKITGHTGPTGT